MGGAGEGAGDWVVGRAGEGAEDWVVSGEDGASQVFNGAPHRPLLPAGINKENNRPFKLYIDKSFIPLYMCMWLIGKINIKS